MALTLKQAHLEAIHKLKDTYIDDLASGSASSHEDYRHKVGIIEGLCMAEREFLDITDKIERED